MSLEGLEQLRRSLVAAEAMTISLQREVQLDTLQRLGGEDRDAKVLGELAKVLGGVRREMAVVDDIIDDLYGAQMSVNIMVGIPGSGKSHRAAELLAEGWVDVVISSDDIREELTGSASDLSMDAEVWAVVRSRAIKALMANQSPLIDATNLTRWARQPYLTLAQQYVKLPIAWVMDTSYGLCLMRNNDRERVVPLHVMERMHTQLNNGCYESALRAEGWAVKL